MEIRIRQPLTAKPSKRFDDYTGAPVATFFAGRELETPPVPALETAREEDP